MSEMDQEETGGNEDKIEDVIEMNHHGHNPAVGLQLPLASDSNNHANMEGEQSHGTSENTNDNNISGGFDQGKKRNAHLIGSNIQDNSVSQSKVSRLEITERLLDSGAEDTALIVAIDLKLGIKMVKLLLAEGAQTNLQNKMGCSALHKATLQADVDLVQLLVESEADLEIKTYDNETAYLLPAGIGDIMLIKTLQNHGANTSAVDSSGCNALMLAIQFARERSIETSTLLYLTGKGAQINHQCNKGYTALMLAAKARKWELLKPLIDHGAVINRGCRDETALMQLVKSECRLKTCDTELEIMKLLLHNEASTCSDQSSELSVLCIATRGGWTDMVRLLCEHGVELYEMFDNQTALMIAAELGHFELVEILLDHGASVNIQNYMKLDALLIALKFGQVDCAKLLLSRGAHLDLPTAVKLTLENKQSAAFQFLASHYKIDVNKDNLLHLAVELGMEDIVSILINLGADVNKGDCYGITPLQVALSSQQGESLIKCLIQNGACVNGIGEFIPLFWSMDYSVEITKLLLDSGADVNARENFCKDTALIEACDQRLDIEIVKLLLAKGAQPNLQNKMGWTALHMATVQADVDLVHLLVELGADLEIKTHDNETAYLLAASEGDIKLIQALQNLGANTSAVDSSGYNALMLAIQFASERFIETSTLLYLAGNGAQINHQCNNGYTALMVAAESEEWKLLKPLIEFGADVHITASFSPGRNFTALSLLLNNSSNCSLENDFMECIKVLIRHGAVNSLPKSGNDVLHEMIANDDRRMIQFLLTNGMAPTMTSSDFLKYMPLYFKPMPVFQSTELSLLTVALVCGNIQIAEYLVGNWALCPCDLNCMSLKRLRDFLVDIHESESVEIVDKLLCQPASLLQLSFITVSHALGGVSGREDRINSLTLPQVIKKKLMFREEAVQIDLTDDDYDSDSD